MADFDPDAYLAGKSQSGFNPDAYLASKTQQPPSPEDNARQVLQEMPWLERNIVGFGGVSAKALEGLKGLFSGQVDPSVSQYQAVSEQEAPVGSMVGEVAKYAPAFAATAALPAAALAGGLGYAYEPGNIQDRLLAGGKDAALSLGASAAIKGLSKGYEWALKQAPTQRAANALREMVGEANLPRATALTQGAGNDLRSAQVLSELDNPTIAAMDKATRSNPVITADIANQITARDAAQNALRLGTLEQMARGGSSEEAALYQKLMIQMAEKELGPVRTRLLRDLAASGQSLDDILPKLGQTEAAYISALQNQGRMATEASQQVVLGQGSRAAPNQVIRELPTGNFPRDPALDVIDQGSPFMARGSQGDYAARAAEMTGAADDLGKIAGQARTDADALRQQISELPAAFTTAPVVQRLENMAASRVTQMNPDRLKVVEAMLEKLKIAGDDPVAIAELRKIGVNQLIGDLIQSGKLSKGSAASALTDVKKLIDKQLGDEFVTKYLEPYSKKLQYRESLKLADELRSLYKDSPASFVKAIRGESPELVEKYSMAPTIQEALGERRFAKLDKIASELERDTRLSELAGKPEGQAALANILNKDTFRKHLPNFLNRYMMIANAALKEGEFSMNQKVFQSLEKAMRDPQEFAKLITMLPPKRQSQMLRYMDQAAAPSGPLAAAAYNATNQ